MNIMLFILVLLINSAYLATVWMCEVWVTLIQSVYIAMGIMFRAKKVFEKHVALIKVIF